jgi:hypothetical protein
MERDRDACCTSASSWRSSQRSRIARRSLWVLRPEDGPVLLGAAARDVSMRLLVERRLYAIEAWIAGGGLAVYLALTVTGIRRNGDAAQ